MSQECLELELVPVGTLRIVAAFQEKKLFGHAICKVNLGPAMEWDTLVCRENCVQSSDPQAGIL